MVHGFRRGSRFAGGLALGALAGGGGDGGAVSDHSQRRLRRLFQRGPRSGKVPRTLSGCFAAVVRLGLPVVSAPEGITTARRGQVGSLLLWWRGVRLDPAWPS